jgi:hypothetical protein
MVPAVGRQKQQMHPRVLLQPLLMRYPVLATRIGALLLLTGLLASACRERAGAKRSPPGVSSRPQAAAEPPGGAEEFRGSRVRELRLQRFPQPVRDVGAVPEARAFIRLLPNSLHLPIPDVFAHDTIAGVPVLVGRIQHTGGTGFWQSAWYVLDERDTTAPRAMFSALAEETFQPSGSEAAKAYRLNGCLMVSNDSLLVWTIATDGAAGRAALTEGTSHGRMPEDSIFRRQGYYRINPGASRFEWVAPPEEALASRCVSATQGSVP